MPIYPVTDISDARLAPYRTLKHTNLTRHSGLFIAEGEKVVRRLLASRYPVVSLLAAERIAESMAAIAPPQTPVYSLPQSWLEELVGFQFHRGVLACGQRIPATLWQELFAGPAEIKTVVVCDQVQQPENLAGILRSSLAFGIDAILVGEGSADPFSRRVLRVSMGASLFLPLVETADLAAEVEVLRREHHFEILATVLDPTAVPLSHLERSNRTAIVLGSEGHGLSNEWRTRADRLVTIHMSELVDSLNVSVAAGVFLYQLMQGR